MIEILVNGEKRHVVDDQNVAGLLEELGFGKRRVAVELNFEIVPRDRYVARQLCHGDKLEIVQAIGGG